MRQEESKTEKSILLNRLKGHLASQEDNLTPTVVKQMQLALKRLQQFTEDQGISPSELTSEILTGYADYMSSLGLSNLTIRAYIKRLKVLSMLGSNC
jgi:hypothetical protein